MTDIPLSPEDALRFNALAEQIKRVTFLAEHHIALAQVYHQTTTALQEQARAILDHYPMIGRFTVINGGKSG